MDEIMELPFMVALVESRYEDLLGLFPGFRQQLSRKCNTQNIAAHEAHVALIIIKDEITHALEEISGAVVKTLKRALIVVQNLISHVKLRIIYPHHEPKSKLTKEDNTCLKALATSGQLSKKQIIALGCSVYETAFIQSGITRTAFIIGFGQYFNVTITESYARTAITDIRNDFKDGVPAYFSIFGERLASKMERLNQESDEAYDKKVRAYNLAHKNI